MLSRRDLTKGEEFRSCSTVGYGEFEDSGAQASLLGVENSQNSSSKKIIDVKDRLVKARVTMDSGAMEHVMPETMFPRVKRERKTSPPRFVAANGERIRDLGERLFHSRRRRKFKDA